MLTRSVMLKQALRRVVSLDAFILVSAVLFWYLRALYWRNHEEPFSDIWGYVATGSNIAQHFFFGLDAAHPTYYTPITPSLIAVGMLIGGERYELAFRLIVQAIAFLGAGALAHEITLATRRRWLGAAFFFIVAICRPSIFWSLKLATEPVCEAMLYASAATALATLRTRSLRWALAAGFFALMLGLNRPSFLPGALLVPAVLLFCAGTARANDKTAAEGEGAQREGAPRARSCPTSYRGVTLVAAFCAAFFGIWSLWIGRNLINYGAFVPTSSSSGQSILWEYGGGPVKIGRYDKLTLPDGTTFSNFGQVTEEAARYPFDFEGAKRLRQIASAWYTANWQDLPRVFLWRLKHIIANRGASGLTRLSREDLFIAPAFGYNSPYTPTAWLNLILIDKTPTVCLLAFAGLLLLAWRTPSVGFMLIVLCLTPWFAGAAVIGYERVVESLIAVTVWLALFAIAETAERFRPAEKAAAS